MHVIVAFNCNSQSIFDRSKVRDIPLGAQICLELVIFFGGISDAINVIDVDPKNDCSHRGLAVVYAWVFWALHESPLSNCVMEGLVPNSSRLLHTIYAFTQFHDLVFFPRFLETGRLL